MHPSLPVKYRPEAATDDGAIEKLHADSFGPGRFARAAFRVREGGPHCTDLSFVAVFQDDEALAGSVRLTRICIGEKPGFLLLGPLAVQPELKNKGIGRALMRMAIDAAGSTACRGIVLVGDAPYYAPFGFVPARPGSISLPGPVDPRRLLVLPLQEGAFDDVSGMIRHAGRSG